MIVPPTMITSIASTISKMVSNVGPMIAKYAPIVIDTVGNNFSKFTKIVEAISKITNVFGPNDSVDELGTKAMSAEKKPEDFDNIGEYIKYLRNDVKIEPDKISNNPIDILMRQVVGAAIAIKGIGNVLGANVSLPFLNTVSKLDLDPKVIVEIAKSYEISDVDPDGLQKYLDNSLSIEETCQHSKVLVSAYQMANPEMSLEEAEEAVMELR